MCEGGVLLMGGCGECKVATIYIHAYTRIHLYTHTHTQYTHTQVDAAAKKEMQQEFHGLGNFISLQDQQQYRCVGYEVMCICEVM